MKQHAVENWRRYFKLSANVPPFLFSSFLLIHDETNCFSYFPPHLAFSAPFDVKRLPVKSNIMHLKLSHLVLVAGNPQPESERSEERKWMENIFRIIVAHPFLSLFILGHLSCCAAFQLESEREWFNTRNSAHFVRGIIIRGFMLLFFFCLKDVHEL